MSQKACAEPVKDTEARILQAAEHEFMTKGYAGARTTSIADAAGVTHAMLHYYFRTKANLFDRILAEKVAMLRDVFYRPEDMELPLDEFIRNVISRHLDFIAANPELPRFMISEFYRRQDDLASFTDKIREYAPLMFSVVQDKINRAADAGKCRQVDARMLMLDIASLNIFSFMASPVVNAVLGPLVYDADAFLARRKAENYDTIICKLKP